jgi:hypothetical protein
VFFAIGLPVGFIGVALVLAVTQTAISGPAVLPWALLIAVACGVLGGLHKPSA